MAPTTTWSETRRLPLRSQHGLVHMATEEYTGPAIVLPPFDSLWTRASLGQWEDVRKHLDEGADMEYRGGPGRSTALVQAVIGGHADVVLLLIIKGADVSTEDSGGRTPLHLAAMYGTGMMRMNVLKVLLAKRADLSAKSHDGQTPLHYAACAGREAAVSLLLQHGADVRSESKSGNTAEDVATAGGHTEVVALLQAEALRISQCEAFAMGHQERLGAGSRVRELDAGVVRMVLEYV